MYDHIYTNFKENKNYGMSLASLYLFLSISLYPSYFVSLPLSLCLPSHFFLYPVPPPLCLQPLGIWPADPGNPGWEMRGK